MRQAGYYIFPPVHFADGRLVSSASSRTIRRPPIQKKGWWWWWWWWWWGLGWNNPLIETVSNFFFITTSDSPVIRYSAVTAIAWGKLFIYSWLRGFGWEWWRLSLTSYSIYLNVSSFVWGLFHRLRNESWPLSSRCHPIVHVSSPPSRSLDRLWNETGKSDDSWSTQWYSGWCWTVTGDWVWFSERGGIVAHL